jgi:hypothetical protein
MYVGGYLGVLQDSEQQLAGSFMLVASRHPAEPEVLAIAPVLAAWSREHALRLQPFLDRYGKQQVAAPALHGVLFQGSPLGGRGLLRDLQDLSLLVNDVRLTWVMLSLAAKALRDVDLQDACRTLSEQTLRQLDWLKVHIEDGAPQALIAAP